LAVKRITRDWLLSAEMDLRSIERVLDDEFLAPVACFHAQQFYEFAAEVYRKALELVAGEQTGSKR